MNAEKRRICCHASTALQLWNEQGLLDTRIELVEEPALAAVGIIAQCHGPVAARG
jgi:hypothetical protein